MNEGYEIPSDLKYTEKPWWGLSNVHALMAVCGLLIILAWYKVILYVGLDWHSGIFKNGVSIIILLLIVIILFKFDIWTYRFVMYLLRPYRLSKMDSRAKSFSGVIGVEGNHFYNRYGDVCAILRLRPINSDRVDPEKTDMVESNDRDFLNSLPCPIQIVGYTYKYDMNKYFESMLKHAEKLPTKVQKYLIAHLDFYRSYCDNLQLNERIIYMIIKTHSSTAKPIEELEINTEIIKVNLVKCGVAAEQLVGDEISNTIISTVTGIGALGIDYITPYTEVDEA